MKQPANPLFHDSYKPAISMVHLQPLPGSPRNQLPLTQIIDAALHDAGTLIDAGTDALMLENFGDSPFFASKVPGHVIADMTAVACALRHHWPHVPLGINVLRNDGCAAIAVAAACGATAIRVNVLCGARVTDQGLIEGCAADLLRLRRTLNAEHISIWADVDVKHSAPLGQRPLEDEVADVIHRGAADAVIVSGSRTGRTVDPQKLQKVRDAAAGTPVLLGSGVDASNLSQYLHLGDGFIVGSALKTAGNATNPVDPQRAAAFMQAFRSLQA